MSQNNYITAIIVNDTGDASCVERCRASIAWADSVFVLNPHDAASNGRSVADKLTSAPSAAWVLVLDAHEWLSDDAASLIIAELNQADAGTEAFSLPRYTYFKDRILQGPNFYPDHQVRLVRATCVSMVSPNPSQMAALRLNVREPTVRVLTKLHLHRAVGDSIQAWASFMEKSSSDILSRDESNLQDAIIMMHTIIARAGADVDGDTGVALSYLMAWRVLVDGLIRSELSGSTRSLNTIFALPMMTVQRVGDDGLQLLISERNSHLQMIRDLQYELANRPHGVKYVIALIKETAQKYWLRLRQG